MDVIEIFTDMLKNMCGRWYLQTHLLGNISASVKQLLNISHLHH